MFNESIRFNNAKFLLDKETGKLVISVKTDNGYNLTELSAKQIRELLDYLASIWIDNPHLYYINKGVNE